MFLPKRYYKIVEKILVFSLCVIIIEFCFPHHLQAKEIEDSVNLGPVLVQITADENMTEQPVIASLPTIENKTPKMVRWVTVTAYSSTVDQCDDSPFITANGKHVYDGLVATNFLYFGTKVKFPDYFGDKVFTVDDRMNSKYQTRMDIWMETREEAKQFGVRYLKVEIY